MGGEAAFRGTHRRRLEATEVGRALPRDAGRRRALRLLGAALATLAATALLISTGAAPGRAAPSTPGGQAAGDPAGSSAPASWPTPGYSEEELRPVVEALLQLATGASPGPTVAPPDPAPSSTPRTTGPGKALTRPDAESAPATVPAPTAAPASSSPLPVWLAPVVLIGAAGGASIVIRRRQRHRPSRLRRRHRGPTPPAGASGAPPVPVEPGILGTADRVDLALRHAWEALRRSGRDDRPSVAAVRVGALGVEVLLDTPELDAPGRFVASAGGHAWTLGADVTDEELQASAGDEPAPLPALVNVGTTPEGPVLVDLLHAGTLSVEGDSERVAGFLAGAALELATAPWAVGLAVGLVGGDGRLAALDRVEALQATGPTTSHGPVKDWLERVPTAAVVVSAATCDEVDDLAAVVGAYAGRAGFLAPGPVPGAIWRLVVDAAGQAVLHPLGLELSCAVDTDAVEMTVGALSAGTVSPSPPTTEPDGQGEQVDPHHGVAVLGTVVVRWPVGAGVRRPVRRKLEEVVVYLATHRERPVPADRLRTAIWPLSDDERSGEVSDASFRATMSRARSALGAGPDGRPWLPEARERCYQLDAGFGCDWVDFNVLVRRAGSAPAPEATALLRRALGFVRGAPFADAPSGAYGWAWDEQLVSAIEVAVADAAERLAVLALAADDHATARWAAAKGLLAVPTRESLYRLRMRAAFEAGDTDDVEQAYTEARRAVRAVDPAEAPQGETTALYERLRRATRPAREEHLSTVR